MRVIAFLMITGNKTETKRNILGSDRLNNIFPYGLSSCAVQHSERKNSTKRIDSVGKAGYNTSQRAFVCPAARLSFFLTTGDRS